MLSFEQIKLAYPESQHKFSRNILREYLQHKILEILFNTEIATQITFIGGTALRLCYGLNRFSEDLDFDNFNLSADLFDKQTSIITKKLEEDGFEVRLQSSINEDTYHYHIGFPSLLFHNSLSPHWNETILIKVDTQAQNFQYPINKFLLNKFGILTEINLAPLDILLSMKINALLSRSRFQGRDIFDILFLSSMTQINYEYIEAKLNINDPCTLKNMILDKIQDKDLIQSGKDIETMIINPDDLKKMTLFRKLLESGGLG